MNNFLKTIIFGLILISTNVYADYIAINLEKQLPENAETKFYVWGGCQSNSNEFKVSAIVPLQFPKTRLDIDQNTIRAKCPSIHECRPSGCPTWAAGIFVELSTPKKLQVWKHMSYVALPTKTSVSFPEDFKLILEENR